jgi:hypothetical protein
VASPNWKYEESTRRYRNTETGRFLAKGKVLELRDAYVDAQKGEARSLATKFAAGDIDLSTWEKQMRSQIKETFLAEALLGRGGRGAMTARDYGALGRQVRTQYSFLRAFATEIAEDGMSEARIASRSAMYVEAATQAYERARAGAYGLKLPAYPGDGGTECKSNCRCSWEIDEDDSEWRATWVLGSSEHCEGCEENAGKWNPLTVVKKKAGD